MQQKTYMARSEVLQLDCLLSLLLSAQHHSPVFLIMRQAIEIEVVMSTLTLCPQYFLKGMEVSHAMVLSCMGWGTDSPQIPCKTRSGFVEAGHIPKYTVI